MIATIPCHSRSKVYLFKQIDIKVYWCRVAPSITPKTHHTSMSQSNKFFSDLSSLTNSDIYTTPQMTLKLIQISYNYKRSYQCFKRIQLDESSKSIGSDILLHHCFKNSELISTQQIVVEVRLNWSSQVDLKLSEQTAKLLNHFWNRLQKKSLGVQPKMLLFAQ